MNASKFAQHLLADLPALVARNIIDPSAADALRRHYEPQASQSTRARAPAPGLAISAILGALLVGAGIILLIAHNWDDLSKPMRAILALLPLLASIALSAHTLLRRMDSTAWREGCGLFYFLSIGASIALVSQTYHLYNDLAGFLFIWTLLSLPLMYLLNSGAAFACALACAMAHVFCADHRWWRGDGILFSPTAWLWIAATLPFYAWHVWRRAESLMVTWLSWALALALLVMLGSSMSSSFLGFEVGAFGMTMACGLMFVVWYLMSCHWFAGMRGWRAPFRGIGTLGIAALAVALTFRDFYEGMWSWRRNILNSGADVMTFLAVAYLAWLVLAGLLLWRRKHFNWAAACFPVMLALLLWVGPSEARPSENSGAWLPLGPGFGLSLPLIMIAYVFLLGVFTLVSGIKRGSLLSMNEGAILIAALVVSRFFNDDYSFIARGVAFIVIGCGFLALNLIVMSRRRKQKARGEARAEARGEARAEARGEKRAEEPTEDAT